MRRRLSGALASLALALTGCGHHHHRTAGPTTAPQPAPACEVVGVAYVDILRRHHLTFEQVVRQQAPKPDIVGTGAALSFARGASGHRSMGPYGAVVDYLADRWAGRVAGPAPERVLASARRLDTDLAHGLCAGFRTGS